MIGHAKNDGRLSRNHLLGIAGDKINALLAAAALNLRLILKHLRNFLRLLFIRPDDELLANLALLSHLIATAADRHAFAVARKRLEKAPQNQGVAGCSDSACI